MTDIEKLARKLCRKYHHNENYTGRYPNLVDKGWEQFIPEAKKALGE